MSLFGFDIFSLILTFVFVFVAGFVRGYSGFGFAMVAVTGISLVFPPAYVVPLVLALEVLASIHLMPTVWRDIDWYSLRWLLAGAFLATPVGVYLLATIPAEPMRLFISLFVFGTAMVLLYGWTWKRMPNRPLIFSTGLACGLLNGAAAIGGPPVILFYLSSPAGITVSRASIIAYFFGIDAISLVIASGQGLVHERTLLMAIACLFPLYCGISIGKKFFTRTDQELFRSRVIILLIILSCVVFVRTVGTLYFS